MIDTYAILHKLIREGKLVGASIVDGSKEGVARDFREFRSVNDIDTYAKSLGNNAYLLIHRPANAKKQYQFNVRRIHGFKLNEKSLSLLIARYNKNTGRNSVQSERILFEKK